MHDSERFKLRFGPYKSPLYRIGAVVTCAARGQMQIVATSAGRIPWPLGRPVGARGRATLVVYRGLAKAVQRESCQAVAYWWGAGRNSVWKWRSAFRVPANNTGTSALRKRYSQEDWFKTARAKAHAKLGDPARRAKIAAAMRGKPRPKHVIEAMRQANLGRKLSPEQRRRMSETHKALGTRPPWLNPAWEPWEDELVYKLSTQEAAHETGRTVAAVKARKRILPLEPNPPRRCPKCGSKVYPPCLACRVTARKRRALGT